MTDTDASRTHTLESFQGILAYRFTQPELLQAALTHTSYANEHPDGQEHNERLEYLGDAVLELAVSALLYRHFPHAREGELTRMRSRLVSEPALAQVAYELELGSCLLLGRGEEAQGGRQRASVLSDAVEAVLGAVFLDGGYGAASQLIERIFSKQLPHVQETPRRKDYKTRLQEYTQKKQAGLPVYTLIRQEGPEHQACFTVQVTLPDSTVVTATGQSLKKAEQSAAKKALDSAERKEKL